jgi:LmbE family N-acetylglucosaminyl deacetylase
MRPTPLLALTALLSLYVSQPARAAGPPAQPDAAQIALGLRKLGVVGSVLYVAAHPDDENTALLAYLANGALVRTAYLSITRGDGGQNLVGSEQGPALGLIRTQELLAARRRDGAEQFFTRARDFGFSKSPDETLRIWGKDAVLADVVAVIRRFRPDVIVTRFSPEPADTHGHHTASAMLAVEAFKAAADPHYHPEQLTGDVTPWQARRIYWNRSTWAIKPTDDLSGDLKVDVGGYNALLGASYGEIAADSRSMHKSQGFGVARSRAPTIESFHLLAGTAPPAATKAAAPKAAGMPSLLAGIELGWKRFPAAAKVGPLIARAVAKFDPAAPQASIPALAAIDAALDAVPDVAWRAEKKGQVRDLALACAGLFAEATAPDFRAAPGATLEIAATAVARAPVAVKLEDVRFPFDGGTLTVGGALDLPAGPSAAKAFETKRAVHLPDELPPSTPYWLEAPPDAGAYRTPDPALIGLPERPSPLAVDFTFALAGRRFTVRREVDYKWTDPVMGERYRSVEVTPAVSVRPEANVLLFPGGGARTLGVRLTAGAASPKGVVRVEAPAGWWVDPPSQPFALGAAGSETRVVFQVRPSAGAAGRPPVAQPGALHVIAESGGRRFTRGVVRIEHPHIPIQTYLVDADVQLMPVDLAKGGVARIGYVPGPGDEVPASLRGVGYEVTLLSDEALAAGAGPIGPFDAVVIGVRAFNTSERLRAAHAALMAYVEGGGTLVVQYNTNNRLAPLTAPLGPWPFEIGQKRVTDETAAVAVLSPKHPALTTPNPIGPHDFDGWIQERGLYFADKWDPHYETPIAMHDPGEAPLAGSLLWARYGKGTFIYTGLAFFRQLPAGVPGAYRLFANLLAGGSSAHGH